MAASFVFLNRNRRLHRAFEHQQVLWSVRSKAVQRAGLDEDFQAAFGKQLRIDAFGEIVNILEQTVLLAFVNDRLQRHNPDALNRTHAERHFAVNETEFDFTAVDVRRQNLQLHATRVVDVFADSFGTFHFA